MFWQASNGPELLLCSWEWRIAGNLGETMVHSTFAQGHVMGGRETGTHGGIPKSPSFHSGLDLAASASVDSLSALSITTPTTDRYLYTTATAPAPKLMPGNNSHRNVALSPSVVIPLPSLKGLNLFIVAVQQLHTCSFCLQMLHLLNEKNCLLRSWDNVVCCLISYPIHYLI